MAALTLTPDSFSLVLFDRDELVAVIARVADRVGFPPERELVVAVEEATPLQRVTVRGLDPVTIDVEGGAFEDPKRPRRLSVETTETVMAMVLHRIKDRLDGSFADAPPDSSLTQAQMAAWNTFAVGRSDRAGFATQQQRLRYAFRNKHAFSDAADAVFDRLWSADALRWSELAALSAEAAG